MCGTSLVFPKQSVLRISIRSTNLTVLTMTRRNIIETRPRAARWAKPLDFTKQKLLRQSIVRHPENMTLPVIGIQMRFSCRCSC